MGTIERYSEPIKKQLLSQFRGLMRACSSEYDKASMMLLRKSFEFLVSYVEEDEQLHEVQFVEYSTRLARLAAKEFGLDVLGVSAALIIHCVDLKRIHIDQVRTEVGERSASIVEELLKISNLDTTTTQGQAENMRNLILTLATDFRVIMVKLARASLPDAADGMLSRKKNRSPLHVNSNLSIHPLHTGWGFTT